MPKSLEYAQALRGWEENHPWQSAALGFVPVAGSIYGLASAAAAARDPEASTLDKSLAGLSITPFGALAKVGRKIIGGKETIKKMESIGLPTDTKFRYGHPDVYQPPVPKPRPPGRGRGPQQVGGTAAPGKHAEYGDRIELPDFQLDYSSLLNDLGSARGGKAIMLRDYMFGSDRNRELKRLFPELKDLLVKTQSEKGGTYYPGAGIITMKPTSAIDARNTLSHEIQHATQDLVENYPARADMRGTSPEFSGWNRYITNMGEMEARINALRAGGGLRIPNPTRGKAEDSYSGMVEYLDNLQLGSGGLKAWTPEGEMRHVLQVMQRR